VGVWDYVVVSVWSGREGRKEKKGKGRKGKKGAWGRGGSVCVCVVRWWWDPWSIVFNTTMKVDESSRYHAIAARD
jgi:hypothetical protein